MLENPAISTQIWQIERSTSPGHSGRHIRGRIACSVKGLLGPACAESEADPFKPQRDIGAFQPEHAGKMNFYLAALDDTERQPGDGPSIGLILCRERNRVVVEYALRNVSGPIGVAE